MASGFVKLDVDYKDTKRALDFIGRRQLPFVYAKTLTQVAGIGQLQVRSRIRSLYDLHTDWIPRGIRIDPARKRDITSYGMAESRVYSSKAVTPFIGLHEHGGYRGPKRGRRAINIGGRDITSYSYKTTTGAIRKRWKPSTLLKDYKGQTRGRKLGPQSGGNRNKAFIIRSGSAGNPLVVRRRGRRGVNLELMWMWIRRAKIKATLNAEGTVRKAVNRNFERLFRKNMVSARRGV